jgi:hypothetical protein
MASGHLNIFHNQLNSKMWKGISESQLEWFQTSFANRFGALAPLQCANTFLAQCQSIQRRDAILQSLERLNLFHF